MNGSIALPLVKSGNLLQQFPQEYFSDIGHGEATPQRSYSPHLLAESLLSKHHIFMQAFSKLRCVKIGCSDARCFAASPFGLCSPTDYRLNCLGKLPSLLDIEKKTSIKKNRIMKYNSAHFIQSDPPSLQDLFHSGNRKDFVA